MSRGLVAGSLLVVFASFMPVPFVITRPGPTFNTIGKFDGQPLIEISGTRTYPTSGHLDMTTVSERGGVSEGVQVAEVLVALARSDQVVVPRDARFPPDASGEQIRAANRQLFATSQSDAIGAALHELRIPAEESVVVGAVEGGSPADGVIEAGDVVLRVGAAAVTDPAQVGERVRAAGVGSQVEMQVRRTTGDKAENLELAVTPAANPDGSGNAFLGISVAPVYEAPFDIDFTLDTVGGPSAGLMFSLGIIDKLSSGRLNGGKHVAGTGTITPAGQVGAIGGIQHKLVGARRDGAELFLAPVANCDEVLGHVPDGLTVIAVDTLHEARTYLQEWVKDPQAKFPTCEDAN
ncbi:MAG: PDZ domain-containing protein [Candidatus Nanopelagicales bacterium]